jgi:hypothetical protein
VFSHAWRLRWSGEVLQYDINIAGVADRSVDLGVPGGSALLALVDAFAGDDAAALEEARTAVREALGDEAFVDAAAVFGNFEMMNRVAEGVGLPIAPQAIEREAEMMKILGLYDLMKSHLR